MFHRQSRTFSKQLLAFRTQLQERLSRFQSSLILRILQVKFRLVKVEFQTKVGLHSKKALQRKMTLMKVDQASLLIFYLAS